MIPFNLLPTLSTAEFFMFQLIQTCLHFILLISFLFLGLKLLYKNERDIQVKEILKIGAIIEVLELITVFSINFLISFSTIFYALGAVLVLVVDFMAFDLVYSQEEKLINFRMALLFCLSIIPAFLLSIILTDAIFYLLGIPDALILYF